MQDEELLVFPDHRPAALHHLLVIPKVGQDIEPLSTVLY